jgi:hypothetical protein
MVAVVTALQQQLGGWGVGSTNAPEERLDVAFTVNTNVMTKVVTTILQNTKQFATIEPAPV